MNFDCRNKVSPLPIKTSASKTRLFRPSILFLAGQAPSAHLHKSYVSSWLGSNLASTLAVGVVVVEIELITAIVVPRRLYIHYFVMVMPYNSVGDYLVARQHLKQFLLMTGDGLSKYFPLFRDVNKILVLYPIYASTTLLVEEQRSPGCWISQKVMLSEYRRALSVDWNRVKTTTHRMCRPQNCNSGLWMLH